MKNVLVGIWANIKTNYLYYKNKPTFDYSIQKPNFNFS